MKKMSIILALALLLGCLTGCGAAAATSARAAGTPAAADGCRVDSGGGKKSRRRIGDG